MAGQQYGGVSAEQRQQLRRERLLAATLQMTGANGVAGLTVRSICACAGLNDRYFYELFTSCDQIAVVVFDQQIASVTERLRRSISAAPISEAAIRSAVATVLDVVDTDANVARLLIDSSATDDLRRRRSALVDELVELKRIVAKSLPGTQRAQAVGRTLALRLVTHGELDLVVDWLRGDLPAEVGRVDLEEFLAQSVEVAMSSPSLAKDRGEGASGANHDLLSRGRS